MQTERQREAAEFRAQGGQKAQEIRAKADREATVIIAEANSSAEQVRGQGDGERNRLFADAYNQDPAFFAFYRSMTAYENSLKGSDTRFLLRPDSDFFRFFGSPGGRPLRRRAEAVTPGSRRARAPVAKDSFARGDGQVCDLARSGWMNLSHDAARTAHAKITMRESRPMTIAFGDFLIGLGILFMIEGILFAAAPEWMRRAMKSALATPDKFCGPPALGRRSLG